MCALFGIGHAMPMSPMVPCDLACQDALARVDVRFLCALVLCSRVCHDAVAYVPFGAMQDVVASVCVLGRMPVVRTCHLTGHRVISRRRVQASRSIYRRRMLLTPPVCTLHCALRARCSVLRARWWGTGFQGLLHLEQACVRCLALAMQCL